MLKTKWIVGGLIIVAVIVGLSFFNLGENIVYFYTPSEVFADDLNVKKKNIRIGGMVKPETVREDFQEQELNFVLTDFKKHEIAVAYRGIAPDLFKEGQGVVAEGYFDREARTMQAHTLMVKHSEEYRVPHDADKQQDKQLLIKSILEN